MRTLADLLKALETRHAEFFESRWDSLSAEDAKRFAQIERDMMQVRVALGQPGREMMTRDLQECIDRLKGL